MASAGHRPNGFYIKLPKSSKLKYIFKVHFKIHFWMLIRGRYVNEIHRSKAILWRGDTSKKYAEEASDTLSRERHTSTCDQLE